MFRPKEIFKLFIFIFDGVGMVKTGSGDIFFIPFKASIIT